MALSDASATYSVCVYFSHVNASSDFLWFVCRSLRKLWLFPLGPPPSVFWPPWSKVRKTVLGVVPQQVHQRITWPIAWRDLSNCALVELHERVHSALWPGFVRNCTSPLPRQRETLRGLHSTVMRRCPKLSSFQNRVSLVLDLARFCSPGGSQSISVLCFHSAEVFLPPGRMGFPFPRPLFSISLIPAP